MAYLKAIFASIAMSAAAFGTASVAGPILHEDEPIYRADVEIDFWEHGFLGGLAITDEYQAYGVTFSGQLKWIRRVQKRRGSRGATLANFSRREVIDTENPFSIKFDYLVDEVTFGLAGSNLTTQVTALLRGREVGFFETTINADLVDDNVFGFEGLRLDEILISFDNNGYGTTFDTLHYNHALNQRGEKIESGVPAVRYRSIFDDPAPQVIPQDGDGAVAGVSASGNTATGTASQVQSVTAVPLPAPFWLLLAGVGGIALARRRKPS